MLFTEHSTFLIQSSNKIMKLYLKTNFSKSLIYIEISKQIEAESERICFHSELRKFIACARLYSFIIILLELWTFSLHIICTWI